MDRAEFLRRAGGSAAVLVAGPWRLSDAFAAQDPRVRELARELTGPVLGRGDAGYAQARLLFDIVYDGIKPLAVAQCAGAGDVAKTLRWAQKHGLRPAARSGGHCYGGYSTTSGIVIDLSRLAGVTVTGNTAVVGAGARLVDVYTKLWSRGVTIPAGSCATVGVSGLTLGGGHGFLSRKHGLTCDNVLELTLVAADGRRLVCSEREHADLFWACRGGGGGNFGVITSWKFRVHPVSNVSTFRVQWPTDQLQQALSAWQQFAPQAPDELFSVLSISKGTLAAVGQLLGPKSELATLIAPLANAGTPTRVVTADRTYIDAVRMWAGCADLDACHLAPQGSLQRASFAAKSDYARTPLSPAAIATIHSAFAEAPARGLLLLDSYGGAVNRVPKAATAFVHRDMLFSFQYLAYWNAPSEAAGAGRWLNRLHAAMRPYVSGEAYQNYIDPALASWRRAYYGSNLERLVAVKRKYDPGNLFRFAQSIPLKL